MRKGNYISLFLALGMSLPSQASISECDFRELWKTAFCELSGNDLDFMKIVLEQPSGNEAIWAVMQTDYVQITDWKTGSEDAVYFFEVLLKARGAKLLSESEKQELIEEGDKMWGDSVPLEAIGPLMERFVGNRGLSLMYIDTGSDAYGFAIVTNDFMKRWAYVAVAEYLRFAPVTSDVQSLSYANTEGWKTEPHGEAVILAKEKF